MSPKQRTAVVLSLAVFVAVLWFGRGMMGLFEHRYEIPDAGTSRATTPPTLATFPYDVSGKTAILVAHRSVEWLTAKAEIPLVWARGNLVIVEKTDWADDGLAYRRSLVTREALDRLILAAVALEAETGGTVELILSPVDGNAVRRRIHSESLKKLIAAATADTTPVPHTLDAVEIVAKKLAETGVVESLAAWPLPTLPLAKIAGTDGYLSIDRETNRIVQARLRSGGTYKSGGAGYAVAISPRVEGQWRR